MTLGDVLDAAASEHDPLERAATSTGVEWRRGGRVFAVLTGDRAEFLLAPVVGRAALGTPDTGGSDRGPDWVSFAPRELDRAAVDRATAWFASAWRHAAQRRVN